MPESPPLYTGSTSRLIAEVRKRDSDNAALILLNSTDTHEGLPIWQQMGKSQLDSLTADLKHEFGSAQVKFEPIPGEPSTDRLLVVKPKTPAGSEGHAANVAKSVNRFVDEHQIKLDTGEPGPDHFRNLVNGATAQTKLRDGIKSILDDQWLNNDKKTDAIIALMKQRRDERRERDL